VEVSSIKILAKVKYNLVFSALKLVEVSNMDILSPNGFLKVGGVVLVLLGLLGLFALNSPNGVFWLDSSENVAHLVLGVVALIAAFSFPAGVNKWLTVIVGLFALLAAVWGFFVSPGFLGANLEQPADNILHLVVAVWALWAGFKAE